MTGIRLIAGLGNPGNEYSKTRHNVGAWFINELAKRSDITLSKETKFYGYVGRLTINNDHCWLLKPTTYMNESGLPVSRLANYYKIPPENILIAHDELDFPSGKIRLKMNGGHGGHNGLRNIIHHLGAQFNRLRIGISHPGHKDHVTPYVLSPPSKQDQKLILNAIDESIHIIPELIAGNMEGAMRFLHNDEMKT